MRGGKLDRTIVLQADGIAEIDPAGTPTVPWAALATVRAELVEASTTDYLRGYGEGQGGLAIFRVRWRGDVVASAVRVLFEGRTFDLKDVKQIGRRRGLELRCEEVRQ